MAERRRRRGYEALLKRAECGPDVPWELAGSARSLPAIVDEAASWSGPRLSHGDMVRFVDASTGEERSLYVFDAHRPSLVPAPAVLRWRARMGGEPTWSGVWESPGATSRGIALACGSNPAPYLHRRLAVAACECAAQGLRLIGGDEAAYRDHIAAAMVYAATGEGEASVREALRFFYSGVAERLRTATARMASAAVVNAVECCASSGRLRGGRGGDDAVEAFSFYCEAASMDELERAGAAAAGDFEAARAVRFRHLWESANVLRFRAPLSVGVCSACGLRDPLPENFDTPNPFVRLS